MSDLPVTIRAIRDTDKPLILDSWVNSVRYSTPAFFWVPNGICKSIYRGMVTRLLEAKPELFRVLVNEEDEDQIFGWRCGNGFVTHFVFVKKEFRNEGLGRLLITYGWGRRPDGSPCRWVFSHWTNDCERINIDINYKPSLFRELINGLSEQGKAVGSSVAPHDKHARKGSPDLEGGREPRQTEGDSIGMVS